MILKLLGKGIMERSVKIKNETVVFSKRMNGDVALDIQSILGNRKEIFSKQPKDILTFDERGTISKTVAFENSGIIESEIWGDTKNEYTRRWTATPEQLICVYNFKNHMARRIYKPKTY